MLRNVLDVFGGGEMEKHCVSFLPQGNPPAEARLLGFPSVGVGSELAPAYR